MRESTMPAMIPLLGLRERGVVGLRQVHTDVVGGDDVEELRQVGRCVPEERRRTRSCRDDPFRAFLTASPSCLSPAREKGFCLSR